MPCNCPLLYEVHFKLLFSFSPTSWLITSCMYWKWGAVNVELLLRSLLLLSKITPVVNAFRRPPTNYIIWLFVGICCILVSVEGQMKGSLVTEEHVWNYLFLEEPIQSLITSDSCWDVEKYRFIQTTTDNFVLLNNGLYFEEISIWKLSEAEPLWAIVIICNRSPKALLYSVCTAKCQRKIKTDPFNGLCVIPN